MDLSAIAKHPDRHFPTLSAMQNCAARTADALNKDPMLIFLSGELGCGKTTWVQATLHALGVYEPVLSPSYTLVNTYSIGDKRVYHIDFFRLQNAEVGEDMLEILSDDSALCFVEWPEMTSPLPSADLHLYFRSHTVGRCIKFVAVSDKAQAVLQYISN